MVVRWYLLFCLCSILSASFLTMGCLFDQGTDLVVDASIIGSSHFTDKVEGWQRDCNVNGTGCRFGSNCLGLSVLGSHGRRSAYSFRFGCQELFLTIFGSQFATSQAFQ